MKKGQMARKKTREKEGRSVSKNFETLIPPLYFTKWMKEDKT
jgi:hypothetical protein